MHKIIITFPDNITNMLFCTIKTEDGLLHPSVHVDTLATTYLNQGVTMTFDLQNIPGRVGASGYFPKRFIQLAQLVHEIW